MAKYNPRNSLEDLAHRKAAKKPDHLPFALRDALGKGPNHFWQIQFLGGGTALLHVYDDIFVLFLNTKDRRKYKSLHVKRFNDELSLLFYFTGRPIKNIIEEPPF